MPTLVYWTLRESVLQPVFYWFKTFSSSQNLRWEIFEKNFIVFGNSVYFQNNYGLNFATKIS